MFTRGHFSMTIPFSIGFNCLIALFGFHSCFDKFYFPVTPASLSSQKPAFPKSSSDRTGAIDQNPSCECAACLS